MVTYKGLPCLGFPDIESRYENHLVRVPLITIGGITYKGAYVTLKRVGDDEFTITHIGMQPHLQVAV